MIRPLSATVGRVPRRVGHDGCPVGSRALERQYRIGRRRDGPCDWGGNVMSEEAFAWFVGVDWGSEKHQVCILDQQGTVVGERSFPHGGDGLAEMGDWLLSITGAADSVAVAIEVPHGPVVDSLIDR